MAEELLIIGTIAFRLKGTSSMVFTQEYSIGEIPQYIPAEQVEMYLCRKCKQLKEDVKNVWCDCNENWIECIENWKNWIKFRDSNWTKLSTFDVVVV